MTIGRSLRALRLSNSISNGHLVEKKKVSDFPISWMNLDAVRPTLEPLSMTNGLGIWIIAIFLGRKSNLEDACLVSISYALLGSVPDKNQAASWAFGCLLNSKSKQLCGSLYELCASSRHSVSNIVQIPNTVWPKMRKKQNWLFCSDRRSKLFNGAASDGGSSESDAIRSNSLEEHCEQTEELYEKATNSLCALHAEHRLVQQPHADGSLTSEPALAQWKLFLRISSYIVSCWSELDIPAILIHRACC